jgi:hypothetical protein
MVNGTAKAAAADCCRVDRELQRRLLGGVRVNREGQRRAARRVAGRVGRGRDCRISRFVGQAIVAALPAAPNGGTRLARSLSPCAFWKPGS